MSHNEAMRSLRVIFLLLAVLGISGFADSNMTKLTVQVNSADTGKPIDRATVIVRFKHGMGVNLKKIQTSWETKTNQEGRVSIPAIHQGQITIQITAKDFQTFGNVYDLTEENQTVKVKLNRPQSQYSEDAKHP
jgi:5-hydroxyisourate hydrolase-like protein (transthyretin family)